ncbi:MAG: glycosyltransferase family 39 protein [Acidobacteria bacterium]|nr:glycosyltransferase family 39 protein [Acidobacteriota bacterium]
MLLVLGTYAPRFLLLRTRTFDPDEFQHLHATWAVSQGLVPFRDFFEHHMPAMQLLLAPLMRVYDIAGSADAMVQFLFVARTAMAVCAGLAIVLTALLARDRNGGWSTGFIAAALLGTSVVFLQRSLEIRPDTPSLPLWIASLALLARASTTPEPGASRRWFVVAGLCVGGALAFNQKLLLAGPGLAIWASVYVRDRASRDGYLSAMGALVLFGLAAAVPLGVVVVWFAAHGALADLISGTLIGNLGWPREVAASSTIRWMALRDPILSALMVGGFTFEGLALWRSRGRAGSAAAWFSGVSLLALLFVTPTPFPQYMLLILPIGAWFAARLLVAAAAAIGGDAAPGVPALRATLLAAGAGVLALLVPALVVARPVVVHPALFPAAVLGALVAALALSRRGMPQIAVALLLAATSLYSLQQIRWMQGLSNAEQIASMRALHAQTSPATTVLDGFSGLAWFRPYASYYGFLHPGVRAHMTSRDTQAVVALLTRCESAPGVVIMDGNLRALSPTLLQGVERSYRPGTVADTWILDAATSPLCNDAMRRLP